MVKTSLKLLDRVSNFENLLLAFNSCARGKRQSKGFHESLYCIGERLHQIRKSLLKNEFSWQEYRSFYVHDPKKRLIMSAPFMDRVVHHAIHQIVEPIIDPLLSDCVFACRRGKGNRRAAQDLFAALKKFGPKRFAIKLDVSSYFHSIDHRTLLRQLYEVLPDDSLAELLATLLASHKEFSKDRRGIPIGNLTSQLFANFYLMPADRSAIDSLGIDYWRGKDYLKHEQTYYVRYMDDAVFLGSCKARVLDAAEKYIDVAERMLGLKIPISKRMPLGSDSIPFLGYLLGHDGASPLRRNVKRFKKKITGLEKGGLRPSYRAQVEMSYGAWSKLN